MERINRFHWVILVICVLMIPIAWFFELKNHHFLNEEGVTTEGIYLGSKKHINVFQNYYSFRTAQGEYIEFFDDQKKPIGLEKGDTVTIVFTPDEPKNARVKSWD